jgi:hypothetical protein
MQWVCLAILIIGGLILTYGTVIFLIVAFRENFFWGLACLLVPIAGVFFLIKNWEETKSPFLIQVVGGLILGAGLFWLSFH